MNAFKAVALALVVAVIVGCEPTDGDDGVNGIAGPAGPSGAAGPVGPAGQDATFTTDVDADGAEDWLEVAGGTNLLDPASVPANTNGDAVFDFLVGPQGPQGTPGTAGLDGVDGLDGQTGATGAQGPPGPPGPTYTGSDFALSGQACSGSTVMRGILSNGTVSCATAPLALDVSCTSCVAESELEFAVATDAEVAAGYESKAAHAADLADYLRVSDASPYFSATSVGVVNGASVTITDNFNGIARVVSVWRRSGTSWELVTGNASYPVSATANDVQVTNLSGSTQDLVLVASHQ